MTDQLALFVPRRHAGQTLGIEPAPQFTPRAEHLHRADDQGGSIAAAARVVDTGRAATEAYAVLRALRLHPGTTSAELADRTRELGLEIGQTETEWRHTVARRLPGLEDAGKVRATGNRPSIRRPQRGVDPNLQPCTISPGRPQSLRWWPIEESR